MHKGLLLYYIGVEFKHATNCNTIELYKNLSCYTYPFIERWLFRIASVYSPATYPVPAGNNLLLNCRATNRLVFYHVLHTRVAY